ncbi:MAG: Crp/Fnr family transcriptional regulator [Caulobacter sp.]|nr:Crp/Fnr family transcriptional regulator [Caulobacter sp.]
MADSAEIPQLSDRLRAILPSGCAGNRLLAALRPADLAALAPHLSSAELATGQVLFDAGQDVVTTTLPCYGSMVSLLVITRDGDEIEVASIGREGAVGGIVSAGFKPAYGRALVRIPGPAMTIPTARLEEAKARSPALADLFARYADVLLAQMMQSSACNALHSIDQRMCRWLLSTHDRANDATIRLTQETLADMLGVQRTTVTAVAKALQDEGLIRTGRGRIEIVDRPRLERRACECHGQIEAHFQRMLPEVAE